MEIIIPKSGILSKNEIQKFKLMLISSKLKENISKIMTTLNIKEYAKFDFNDIPIPDSSISKKAIEEAQESFNPILLYHSYRTYFWSAGFALSEKLKVDSELLFVSSLLHDIGLAENHNHICSKQCFANYGGDFSKNFCKKNGLEEKKSTIIKQAIDMHLNPIIDRNKYGNETYLLSKGAAMDVIGASKFQFSKKFILDVDKSYSRKGFKEDIINTMESFHHKEGTRADILYKMGFSKMASKNSLDKKL
ncbi:HD domain-containing protein [Empedobacter brevis]|uniref:HD domain-containing protein n=1 Tax=Empedobacter brevis TaxID=247 RepID=UPI0028A19A0E|nr:HD domain-containing protein [Empedobacter brevis]